MSEPLGSNSVNLTWLGHSTVLIGLGSVRLLTDPLLRNRVAHLRRIGAPAVVPDHVDGVLISHAHHDHLDPTSLRLLGRSTPIVLPRGAGRMLRRRGFGDLTEIEAGEETEIRGVRIRATHAEHQTGRGPLSPRSPALGYLVGDERIDRGHWRVYFAGDTDLFDEMKNLAGKIDVALLPVAGWGRRVPAGHLNPERAADAVRLLTPKLAIPIHWGTLTEPWIRREKPDRTPAIEFEREVSEASPGVQVQVLKPGVSTEF